MATEEGLVRFDGVRFKVFDAENTREIPSSQIQVLFEDRQGELWIGTAAGLTRYKDQQFNPYTSAGRLPDKGVSCICQDSAGNVWVGTAGGLWVFDGGKFGTYSTGDGLPNDSIRSLYEDHTGELGSPRLADSPVSGQGMHTLQQRRFPATASDPF